MENSPVAKLSADRVTEPQNQINKDVINHLIDNSKAAIIGAIEIHNKPIFPYRYELVIVLTINAWELALKAFILRNYPNVKVIYDDGTTKPFEECLSFVSSELGKDFFKVKEGIERLYEYRCNIIHFYGEEIELILYSLLRPNILFFGDFLFEKFGIDLGEEMNLVILPIGFKRAISPIDFLSKNHVSGSENVRQFINSITKSTQQLIDNGIEDGFLCDYRMIVENETRIKNADVIAGITKDSAKANVMVNKVVNLSGFTNDVNAPKTQIDEVSLFREKFNIINKEFIARVKLAIPGFRETLANKKLISIIKEDPDCFRVRFLDANPTAKSIRKGFYSVEAIGKLIELVASKA